MARTLVLAIMAMTVIASFAFGIEGHRQLGLGRASIVRAGAQEMRPGPARTRSGPHPIVLPPPAEPSTS